MTPEDKIDQLEETLREIAFFLGVGGYNSLEVDPDKFLIKIKDGIDDFAKSYHQLQLDLAEKRFKELETQKANCKHKNHIVKYGGNTGNYDPTADIYWLDVKCLDCGETICYYDNQPEYSKNWKTK